MAFAAALTSAAWAEGPTLTVEKKGTYVYWFRYNDVYKLAVPPEVTTPPQAFKGESTELDTVVLGTHAQYIKLYVMDKKTGNTAIVDFEKPKDPANPLPIKIKADDFQYVRNVRLKVVSEDGAPLESAVVTITDGMGDTRAAIVTPADEGIATFRDVATGEMSVKVQAEGLKKTLDSDIELPEKRDTPGFERDVKVSGDVDTLEVAAKEPAGEGRDAAKPKAAPGPGSLLLQTLAGLIFLVVVAAVVWAVLKSRGVTAESALKKMGVQVPGDQAADQGPALAAAPAVDPNVCEFCGQRKDASGKCACTVAPGDSPFAAPSASVSSGPRLIGTQGAYSGHIFEITGGSAVIGREPGIEVALVNDSTASRRHATISASNGSFTIRDEGSSNGTFVNGAKVTEIRLTPGDEIQIGGTKFRFEA